MKAGPVVVGQLLQLRARYQVPIYQRSYVWTRQRQWEPFWSDIRTKAIERLAGRPQRFSHYMGAVVLESRGGYSARRVPASQIVDGQQRLTTFQLFLAASRDYAALIKHDSAKQNIERYLINADAHLMEMPEVEVLKVWPTVANRELFRMIITEGRDALRKKYGQHFYAKRDQIYDYSTTPRMLAAYGYFYDRIRDAVEKDALQEELIDADPDEAAAELQAAEVDETLPAAIKLDAIWQALVEEFKVVEIVLEDGDDAQVIFETLNERGEPLLAADLVRNNIFHRAEEADRAVAEKLFRKYWTGFEEPFWDLEEKQGRYKKKRIEFFLANYIAAQIGSDVTITKLFSEYKSFLKAKKFATVEDELAELFRYGVIYRQLLERDAKTPLGAFSHNLAPWDVTTVYPLVLRLYAETGLSDDDRANMLELLLSFIVRRAVCRLTPKNYNKLFLAAVADLDAKGWSLAAFKGFFQRQTADSGRWPRDDEFRRHWIEGRTYTDLGPARTRALLEALETAKRSKYHEVQGLKSGLTVEHILPDGWVAHWPFGDGSTPTLNDLSLAVWSVDEADTSVGRIVKRNRLKQNIGNLTLLTQPMNSKQQNSAWTQKREALQKPEFGSLLVLNKEILANSNWSEKEIVERSAGLFSIASGLWGYA